MTPVANLGSRSRLQLEREQWPIPSGGSAVADLRFEPPTVANPQMQMPVRAGPLDQEVLQIADQYCFFVAN